MAIATSACGIILIAVVLWEAFETIVLPRRVARRFRLTRLFYRSTWLPWTKVVRAFIPVRRQETWLSFYGPLSLIILLSLWVGMLITGFALLQWASVSIVLDRAESAGFLTNLYMSGTTFFTLGIGDVVPESSVARFLVVLETGMGFGFLALVIGYLPALNQSLARREVSISMLDARAGSPPTAAEMLRRNSSERGTEPLRELLSNWEIWAAEFLEGHLSYPVLAYFRSQHKNQSWLAALTAILDTCSLVIAGSEGAALRQAELTFAMARHALADLCLVFLFKPRKGKNRLPPAKFEELMNTLTAVGITLEKEGLEQRLTERRNTYEPYINALAFYFRFTIPPWVPEENQDDQSQDEHF